VAAASPLCVTQLQKLVMKTKALFVLVSLAMPVANLRATPQDEQFQQIAHDYIEGFLTSNPEYATELGDHRFDDKLTDYSAETRAQELARAKQTRQQLEAFNDLSQLTGANRVDIRLLKGQRRQRNFRHRRTEGMGMEPAGLQSKSGQ
jgi:hypothetical protein